MALSKISEDIRRFNARSTTGETRLVDIKLVGDAEVLPVSVSSLPLPTGATTAAKQDLLLTELQAKADLSETQPVSVSNTLLNIAKGNITGTVGYRKFGLAPDFDTGDGEVDVWDGANDAGINQMTYTYSTTADIDSISSSDNTDTQNLEIHGLDTSYNEVIQTVALSGETRVAIPTSLIRVYRVLNTGNSDLAGTPYVYVNGAITAGVPDVLSTVRAVITSGNNQTLMAIYTVPNGKTAYMTDFFGTTEGGSKTTNYTLKLKAKPFGQVFLVKEAHALVEDGASHFNHKYTVPLVYAAKTDIVMTTSITAGVITEATIGAGFDIILVDD